MTDLCFYGKQGEQMKIILKKGVFMAVMSWCITGCPEYEVDQTFNELREISIRVSEANVQEPHTKLFPYSLYIKMNEFHSYASNYGFGFYSDEECTVRLREDALVTINGKPPQPGCIEP
jgi:hypothetical protein